MVISNLLTEEPLSSKNFTFLSSQDEPTLVFISDPLLSDSTQLASLKQTNNLVYISVDEFSFKENALRIKAFTDSLQLQSYHVIGEGIGGSVGIHLTRLDSINVESLTLINANGIEELELLGGYHLNNAIYQTRVFWNSFLINWTPHFGYFNHLNFYRDRSKSQFVSDQRLIRNLLHEISIPVLIAHTSHSVLNESVAREHHRLLPQSELKVLPDHTWIPFFEEFLNRVNNNLVVHRNQVSEFAQSKSLEPFNPKDGVKAEGSALLLLMLVIILSTLISEDLTCIGTGLMIARGLIGFFPGTLACLVGIFVGDILLYLSGRWLASSTLHRAPLKWFISEKDIRLSYHWFEAKGPAIIIASRFIPGSRFPTYFSAGAIGASFGMFILYFGIASIIWTPILLGLAVLLGQEMIEYFSIYQEYALWVLLGVFALLFILFKVIIPSFTFKGRRLLVGRIKRIWNWEFWSPYVIYAPVLISTFFLWIKYRSITLVTLVNPGFKDGGFVNESKSEILNSIQKQEFVARYIFVNYALSIDDKKTLISKFMEVNKLEYPIVLKPDVGQRGQGVVLPKNATQLAIELEQIEGNFIVQEYIYGSEFGVFYVRYPSQESGHIYSITKKKYLRLIGDGKHTLEELILKDSRAVCLAEKHIEQHVDHLFSVPKKGKKIPLVEVGTHSRGAIFLDGIQLKSELLEARINEISKSIEGFYFGRFDLKAPTDQHLKEGNNLKILELNGVTSEATHIYDPKYHAFYGIRVLINQWKLAYQIANEVQKLNPDLKPPGLLYMIQLLR